MKKSSEKIQITIFLYNRLFDPLIQSNFWPFIKDYLNDSDDNIQFNLITYENYNFSLTSEQMSLVEEWKTKGLKWTALQWNPGMTLKSKSIDIWNGFLAMAKLNLQGSQHVITVASIAGTFAYLYSILLPIKIFLYSFEPHSEYARDNGMWDNKSWQFKLSNFLERKAALSAKVITSGTKFMKQRLKEELKVKAFFFKIPSVAQETKFKFKQEHREKIRQKLTISSEQRVLFYPGKFGDLYYREETAFMYKWLQEEIENVHFLIVTPHEDEEIHGYFAMAGVDKSSYSIAHSGYEDIHKYYCAADLAVIAVPRGPSKGFISNIKVGEYLCAGLPYLITEGVSEDYVYATEKNVGVVVHDFDEISVKKAVPEVLEYFNEDKSIQRKRCRDFGLDYRGFENLNAIFKSAITALIKK